VSIVDAAANFASFMRIVWINVIDGQPPRSKHMTGLDQERVDWLHEQVAQMVEWDKPMGCPRVLPLYTAIVMVLFAVRHNLPPDVLREVVRLRVDDGRAVPG
jgi:hypothetical protein